MKRQNYLGRLVFIITMLLVCSPAFGGTILNGGFESGDYTGWTLTGGMYDWNSPVTGNLETIYGPYGVTDLDWPAHGGSSYSAYPGPGDLGYLSHDVSTDPGARYSLTFALSMFPLTQGAIDAGSALTPNLFEVYWNSSLVMGGVGTEWENNTNAFEWTTYTVSGLTPSVGDHTTLSFGFYAPNWSFGLDDVSVQHAPEPASLLLLGTGLMSAGWFLRRKIASGG